MRFASQIRSFTQTVRTVICKWSDQICVSRHRQPIRMGCCGNDIIDCVHGWRGFPTCKHENWRYIIAPSKQSRCRNPSSRIDPAQLPRCTSVTLDRTSSLFCHGTGDSKDPVKSAVRVRTERQRTKSDWNLISNHLQMYLQCANVAFHVVFFLLSRHSQWNSVSWQLYCGLYWSIENEGLRKKKVCFFTVLLPLIFRKMLLWWKSFTFHPHQVCHKVWRASLKSAFWGVKKKPNVHSRRK